ncbi:protein of unknown function [Paraburkholderia dioscoreae]|uniref:Uncharacterized protein n=1 Tax=Paraburkholderia dioscoreae TaxID=2604047 RepID=A0A5Q4ZGK9_9BURK|nr:protein of unknown function [Paraburkholderia dioscoreae]
MSAICTPRELTCDGTTGTGRKVVTGRAGLGDEAGAAASAQAASAAAASVAPSLSSGDEGAQALARASCTRCDGPASTLRRFRRLFTAVLRLSRPKSANGADSEAGRVVWQARR